MNATLPTARIVQGDARRLPIADGSVHAVVTSPPYYALRDYQVSGQLGLEESPAAYVAAMVGVFDEVWRILRDDGMVFLNIGDSYSSTEYGRIREHERGAFFGLPLEVRRQVFGLWRDSLPLSVPGHVREMLSEGVEAQEPASRQGASQAVLRDEQEGIPDSARCPQQEATIGDDPETRRQMRMLRHHRTDVSMPGSHQGGRAAGLLEEGRAARSLETGDPGWIGPGEVPGSLLELQLRAWALWKVPTLQLDLSNVPREARRLFDVEIKPKDALGIPWALAFALRAAGWYLRSECIFHKRSPMPESVTDRPTKAHEQVFLLAKKPRYFYDAEAVKEEPTARPQRRLTINRNLAPDRGNEDYGLRDGCLRDEIGYACPEGGRNLRSVWSIASTPFPGSHFATFPIELAARCIKASTSERGVCGRCGAPWQRLVEREITHVRPPEGGRQAAANRAKAIQLGGNNVGTNSMRDGFREGYNHTTGWQPSCPCGPDSPVVPATVFDPFCGAATTLLAARMLGRHGLGVELNREYIDLSLARLRQHTSGKPDGPRVRPLDGQASLFDLVEGD